MYLLKYSLRLHFICSKIELDHYRPQRSCGQANIFTPVCHSVHRGGSASVHAGIPPPPPPGPGRPPLDQADTPHPPGPGRPPWTRQTPPWTRQTRPPQTRHPPWTRHPPPPDQAPPPEADSSIRSTSGRYASYWNAFLFLFFSNSSIFPKYSKSQAIDKYDLQRKAFKTQSGKEF